MNVLCAHLSACLVSRSSESLRRGPTGEQARSSDKLKSLLRSFGCFSAIAQGCQGRRVQRSEVTAVTVTVGVCAGSGLAHGEALCPLVLLLEAGEDLAVLLRLLLQILQQVLVPLAKSRTTTRTRIRIIFIGP